MFNSNFFDAQKMIKFMKSLPQEDIFENQELKLTQKIAIMTHDDHFDREMYEYEKKNGFTSTFFLLTNEITDFAQDADLQLHYDMSRKEWIEDQINEFKQKIGRAPIINRNHRVFWRENHLDLANFAMHGIKVDTTLLNGKPFKLCVQNRLLPIWEIPYTIVDYPYVDVNNIVCCTYNVSQEMEDIFKRGKTPLIGLFHSYLKEKTQWKLFFELALKYNYKIMNMKQFYELYLTTNSEEKH